MTIPALPGIHREIGSDGSPIYIENKNEVKDSVTRGINDSIPSLSGLKSKKIIDKETRNQIDKSLAPLVRPEIIDKTMVDPSTLDDNEKFFSEGKQSIIDSKTKEIFDAKQQQLKLRQRILDIVNGNINGKEEDIQNYTNKFNLKQDEINRLEGEIDELRKQTNQLIVKGRASAVLEFKSKSDKNATLVKNVLNEFINVQYHMAISMIPDSEVRLIQDNLLTGNLSTTNVDRLTEELKQSKAITIASTGSQFADPDFNYYNIKSINLTNIMTPSSNNPMLSAMVSAKVKIIEPVGLRLHEDIRSMAEILGYKEINPGRIIYRLDIWFSGYNPDTGEWVTQIPMDLRKEESPTVVTYYVAISGMEAKVTSTGTDYDISLVPAGHFAYRPEIMSIDATNVFSSKSNTFGSFLDQLELSLQHQKEGKVQDKLKRNFKFYAPEVIRNAVFYAESFANSKNYIQADRKENILQVGRDIDLLTLLQQALSDVERAQDFFLAEQDNDNFTTPRVHFTIRFNTKYGNKNNTGLYNDYEEITYEYIIEPYISFKEGTVPPESLATYVSRESQLARIKEMLRYGMILRRYDYIYTSENTEILDFNIDLKTFYFRALDTFNETMGTAGIHVTESTTDVSTNRKEQNFSGSVTLLSDGQVDDSSLKRIFGDSLDKLQSGTGVPIDKFHIHGGGYNETNQFDETNSLSGSSQRKKHRYLQLFQEHMKNDLLTLNDMSIRGDPIWLLSPYSSNSSGINDTVEIVGADSKIRPQTGKVIFLKIVPPEQQDYMNPSREFASSYPQMIGGFYEVYKVESSFDSGKFVQKINGVKLNHLNYVEYNQGSENIGGEVNIGMPTIVTGPVGPTEAGETESNRRAKENATASRSGSFGGLQPGQTVTGE